MSISYNGTSLIWDGTVTITNFTDPTNGVVTLTLTPTGGVGALPALVNGQPGQPALIDSISASNLAAGSTATATLTTVSTGGPGSPSHYTIAFGIPIGATGATGTNSTLAGCSDLTGGTVGAGKIITVASTGPTVFQYSSFPWANVYNPSSINTLSLTGNTSGTLCVVNVPGQPYPWYPICLASATVVGTVNTVVNLSATLVASPRSGDVIGQTQGYAGQATQRLSMLSGFGATIGAAGPGYGKVPAATAAAITLTAQETALTSDAWSINNSTVEFTVLMVPVQT